jgi:hypothetical protein
MEKKVGILSAEKGKKTSRNHIHQIRGIKEKIR